MQIFKDQNKRLVKALPGEQPFNSLEGALFADLRIHLLQRRCWLSNTEESEEIGERVLQTAIQSQHPTSNFLTATAFVVLWRDLEIILEQVKQWQIRIRFAVRNREGFQY